MEEMLEHLIVALLGTFALGLATWHTARVISDGDLFKPLRTRFWKIRSLGNPLIHLLYDGVACRLCFNTEIAIVLTWGTLVTGLTVDHNVLPPAEWGFAFAVGPFLTGAWAEIVRRVERWEAPE